MRFSDWSSDVCSSDLVLVEVIEEAAAVGVRVERPPQRMDHLARLHAPGWHLPQFLDADRIGLRVAVAVEVEALDQALGQVPACALGQHGDLGVDVDAGGRSEEHTSELQSLMRISYAVFCLKKKTTDNHKDKDK